MQGTLPLLAASLTGVWLVGAHSRETARVQTKPMYQAALLPRPSDIFVSTSNAPVKKSYSCNYGLPLALFIGLFQEGFNRIPFGKNLVLQSPVYFDTHFFVTERSENKTKHSRHTHGRAGAVLRSTKSELFVKFTVISCL